MRQGTPWIMGVLLSMSLLLTGCGSTQSQPTSSQPAQPAATQPGSPGAQAASSPTGQPSAEKKLVPINVMLDWQWDGKHAFIFAAQKEGYFASEGLAVNFLPPAGVGDSNKFVAAQAVQFGLAFTTDHVLAAQNVPGVVSVAELIRFNSHGVGAIKGRGFNGPKWLAGKTVGASPLPVSQVMFEYFLKSAGMTKNDLKAVTAGFGLEKLLAEGKTDANVGVDYGLVSRLKAVGKEVDFVYFRDYGVPDYPFAVIIANRQYLQKNADVAKAFLRAVFKGMDYAQANPDAVFAWARANMPEVDEKTMKEQWAVVGPQMTKTANGAKGYGYHNLDKMQKLADFLLQNKLMEKPVKAADIATDAFLP